MEARRDVVTGRSKAERVGHVRWSRWCATTGGGPIVGGKPTIASAHLST